MRTHFFLTHALPAASALLMLASVTTEAHADKGALLAPTAPTAPTIATTVVKPPPPPPPVVEETIDLGYYDTSIKTHASYGVLKADTSTYVMAPPNQTFDPCPAPQPTYDWDRVFSKSDDFGNTTFGAGYWAGITFSSRAGRAGGPDSFTGEALLRAYVTLFETDHELARVSGKAALVGTHGSSSYLVRVLGADVRSGSASGNLTDSVNYPATFFSQSKTIWLGPLPVKFTGAVKGEVGVAYQAEYSNSTISLSATPKGKLYAEATAAIDAWLASAGVTGTLTLVEASVPSHADVIVQPNALAWGMASSLQLSSLSGSVDAWAHIPGKTWRLNLAHWDPLYSGSFPIVHVSSCQNPIVRPVCGDNTCQVGETHDNCPSDCAAPPPPPPPPPDPPIPPYCSAKPWMCQDL